MYDEELLARNTTKDVKSGFTCPHLCKGTSFCAASCIQAFANSPSVSWDLNNPAAIAFTRIPNFPSSIAITYTINIGVCFFFLQMTMPYQILANTQNLDSIS